MKRRKTQSNTPHHPTPCEVEGCAAYGEYRAPKQRVSRQHQDYHLFCLEHVREFNKSYNFFNGMDDEAVQAFMKDAVTGHRPTWRLGSDHLLTEADLEQSLRGFFSDTPVTHAPASLPSTLRKALEVFVLTHPTDKSTIKQSYKKLVKQYHPDVNKNDDAAEKFKEIIDLYHVLIEYYPSS